MLPIERPAPAIIDRDAAIQPVQTGHRPRGLPGNMPQLAMVSARALIRPGCFVDGSQVEVPRRVIPPAAHRFVNNRVRYHAECSGRLCRDRAAGGFARSCSKREAPSMKVAEASASAAV